MPLVIFLVTWVIRIQEGDVGFFHLTPGEKNEGPLLEGLRNAISCLSQFGSVERASACRPQGLGSVLTKGMYLGCRLLPGRGPGQAHAGGNQSKCSSHFDVSLCLSLSLPHSLKINGNISSGEDKKNNNKEMSYPMKDTS
uniref:Uncharacterized protein n=1 Tax=Myotis myotis TaxID=51298 RepID=A0A7J7VHX5_MYOMY|nr:hypothetical protein mMyoMyo1_008281 [Myotis myotis]